MGKCMTNKDYFHFLPPIKSVTSPAEERGNSAILGPIKAIYSCLEKLKYLEWSRHKHGCLLAPESFTFLDAL